jgi:hypothetical protein
MGARTSTVMAALVAATYAHNGRQCSRMAGTSPATMESF